LRPKSAKNLARAKVRLAGERRGSPSFAARTFVGVVMDLADPMSRFLKNRMIQSTFEKGKELLRLLCRRLLVDTPDLQPGSSWPGLSRPSTRTLGLADEQTEVAI